MRWNEENKDQQTRCSSSTDSDRYTTLFQPWGHCVNAHARIRGLQNHTEHLWHEFRPTWLSHRLDRWTCQNEAKKMFWRKLHETAIFFKHADYDPDAIHEFYPEQTENMLFFAVYQYRRLTGEWSAEIRLFSTWYIPCCITRIRSERHGKRST